MIEVATSIPSARLIGVLDKLLWVFGLPASLRVDNGPEFISGAMDACQRHLRALPDDAPVL